MNIKRFVPKRTFAVGFLERENLLATKIKESRKDARPDPDGSIMRNMRISSSMMAECNSGQLIHFQGVTTLI